MKTKQTLGTPKCFGIMILIQDIGPLRYGARTIVEQSVLICGIRVQLLSLSLLLSLPLSLLWRVR